MTFRHGVLLLEGTCARPGRNVRKRPPGFARQATDRFPDDFLDDYRTFPGRCFWSRRVTPAAVEEGQARAVGDLPGLLQDGPLLVARVHQAVVDCLSQRLDGGVRPGLRRRGRL